MFASIKREMLSPANVIQQTITDDEFKHSKLGAARVANNNTADKTFQLARSPADDSALALFVGRSNYSSSDPDAVKSMSGVVESRAN